MQKSVQSKLVEMRILLCVTEEQVLDEAVKALWNLVEG